MSNAAIILACPACHQSFLTLAQVSGPFEVCPHCARAAVRSAYQVIGVQAGPPLREPPRKAAVAPVSPPQLAVPLTQIAPQPSPPTPVTMTEQAAPVPPPAFPQAPEQRSLPQTVWKQALEAAAPVLHTNGAAPPPSFAAPAAASSVPESPRPVTTLQPVIHPDSALGIFLRSAMAPAVVPQVAPVEAAPVLTNSSPVAAPVSPLAPPVESLPSNPPPAPEPKSSLEEVPKAPLAPKIESPLDKAAWHPQPPVWPGLAGAGATPLDAAHAKVNPLAGVQRTPPPPPPAIFCKPPKRLPISKLALLLTLLLAAVVVWFLWASPSALVVTPAEASSPPAHAPGASESPPIEIRSALPASGGGVAPSFSPELSVQR